jgi:hypothetical protein
MGFGWDLISLGYEMLVLSNSSIHGPQSLKPIPIYFYRSCSSHSQLCVTHFERIISSYLETASPESFLKTDLQFYKMSGTVDIIAIITPKPGKADRVRYFSKHTRLVPLHYISLLFLPCSYSLSCRHYQNLSHPALTKTTGPRAPHRSRKIHYRQRTNNFAVPPPKRSQW